MNAIRATHTQLRTIITLLDFFLAQSTPPKLSLPLPPAYNNKCRRNKMRADFLCNTLNNKLFSAKICFSCKVLVILV